MRTKNDFKMACIFKETVHQKRALKRALGKTMYYKYGSKKKYSGKAVHIAPDGSFLSPGGAKLTLRKPCKIDKPLKNRITIGACR